MTRGEVVGGSCGRRLPAAGITEEPPSGPPGPQADDGPHKSAPMVASRGPVYARREDPCPLAQRGGADVRDDCCKLAPKIFQAPIKRARDLPQENFALPSEFLSPTAQPFPAARSQPEGMPGNQDRPIRKQFNTKTTTALGGHQLAWSTHKRPIVPN